jgi:hypothetical protein
VPRPSALAAAARSRRRLLQALPSFPRSSLPLATDKDRRRSGRNRPEPGHDRPSPRARAPCFASSWRSAPSTGRRLHLDEQRASEHRVGICVGVAQAIERRLTLPRREQHEHAFGWIHAGQSARHADRAFSFDREWIIAAGIQDEDYRRRALLLQPVGKSAEFCLSGTSPS